MKYEILYETTLYNIKTQNYTAFLKIGEGNVGSNLPFCLAASKATTALQCSLIFEVTAPAILKLFSESGQQLEDEDVEHIYFDHYQIAFIEPCIGVIPF